MANKMNFSVNGLVDLNINGLLKQLNQAKTSVNQLKLPKNLESDLNNFLKQINNQLNDFNEKASGTFKSMGDVKNAQKSFDTLQKLIDGLQQKISNIDTSKLNLKDTSSISRQLKSVENQVLSFSKNIDVASSEVETLKNKLSDKISFNLDINGVVEAIKEGKDVKNVFDDLRSQSSIDIEMKSDNLADTTKKLNELNKELTELKVSQTGNKRNTEEYVRTSAHVKELEKQIKQLSATETKLNKEIEATTKEFESNANIINKVELAFSQLVEESKKLNFNDSNISFKELQSVLNNLYTENISTATELFEQLKSKVGEVSDTAMNEFAPAMNKVGESANSTMELNREIETLQNRFTQFFSIANGWNLVNKAIRNAYHTVKDLDAAMTEIAVVTDFSLDDVWAMRGDYSKEATALGASTLDMVDASKLYYQQGLNQIEVTEVATETIKMARIANLDGTTATNLMTAAIRGFNMEMNEAVKVNDVYSWLAAKTAADTHEIADAMTRTASIADAAGASFENTSAFLTQMIETTRESPENLGTALKTIIARFQELKKAPDQIGEIDGEIVDANAIETALRSIGVALRDTSGDFRNFDDVILDISSTWDSLDKLQQRYIATTAAGSRQQSRFIALVQNNARLTELVGGAANSAGAANEQFNKTLDSLESKMNQMNNALALFWTNLANSNVIKGAIDLFTLLLNVINDATSVLPGATKSVASLLLAFGAFKGASKIINKTFAEIGKAMGVASAEVGGEAGTSMARGLVDKLTAALNDSSIDKRLEGLYGKLSTLEGPKLDGVYNQLAMMGRGFSEASLGTELYTNVLQKLDNGLLNNTELTGRQLSFLTKQEIQTLATADATAIKTVASNLNTVATQRETAAQAASATTLPKLLANTVKLGMAKIGLTTATAAETAQLQMNTIATWKAVVAQYAYLAPLILIGAILGGLAIALKIYSDSIMTNEKRMASLNDSLDKFTQEAEEAQEALSDITSETDNLRDLQDTLNGLTNGTREWKQALLEVNEKVIDLINKYPELIKYYERGANGAMNIKEEGIDELIKLQQARIELVANTELALQAQKMSLQSDIDVARARDANITKAHYDSTTVVEKKDGRDITYSEQQTGVDNANFTEIAKKFTEAGYAVEHLGDASSESYKGLQRLFEEVTGFSLEDYGSEFDSFVEEIIDIETSFEEIGIEAQKTSISLENFNDSIIDNVMVQSEGISKLMESIDNADITSAMKGAASRNFDDVESIIAEKADNYHPNVEKWEDTGDNEDIRKYAKMTYGSDSAENIDIIRQKRKDGELTDAMISSALATNEFTEELEGAVKGTEAFLTKLNNSNDDIDKAILRMTSQEQSNVRQIDIDNILRDLKKEENITGVDNTADLSQAYEKGQVDDVNILNVLGISEEELQNLGFENVEAFINAMVTGEERLGKALSGIEQYMPELKLKDAFKSFTENLSVGELEGVDSLFTEVLIKSGKEGATALSDSISGIFKQLKNDSDRKTFIKELNSLDFSDAESIKNFSNILNDLGVDIDSVDITNLETQLIDLNKIANEVSLDSLREQIKSLFDIKDDLEKREPNDRAFSEEDMLALVDAGVAEITDFQFNGQEFIYLGDTMQALITKIEENTQALIQSSIDTKQTQADIGFLVEGMIKDGAGQETVDAHLNNTATDEQLKTFLTGVLTQSTPEQQQALGYSADTLESADIEQLRVIMDNVLNLMNNAQNNQNMANQMNQGLGALNNQQQSPYMNTGIAGGGMTNALTGQTAMPTPEEMKAAQDAILMNADGYTKLAAQVREAEEAQKIYAISLKSGTAEEQKSAKASLADKMAKLQLATAVEEATERMLKFEGSARDSLNALKHSEEGTLDYMHNLNDLTSAMNQMLDIDLSSDFYADAENIQLLTEALDGSDEAWQRLLLNIDINRIGMADFVDQFQLSAEDVTLISDALNNVEFTIDGKADMTDVMAKLFELGYTGEEVAAFLEKLGYTDIELSVDNDIVGLDTIKSVEDWKNIQGEIKLTATKVEIPAARRSSGIGSGGGARSAGNASKGGGGGGSSKAPAAEKEETPWENSYDWLYNLVKSTNKELRKRNKLEWQYSKMLKDNSKSAKDLVDNVRAQEASLKKQQDYYNQQMSGRLSEQGRVEAEYSDLGGYAKYNETLGMVEINWDAINAVKDQDTGKRIQDYISKLESIESQIEGIEDAQMSIIDQLEEIKNLGKNEYLTLEERVLNAIIAQRQEEIEILTAINENMISSTQKVLDGIQKGINDQRAQRDRDNALESIQEKERRLAMMQSDTSGANQLAIMQLQEELENDRQSYTDSLIDLAIQNIQEGNDVAAEQRQLQIELMQSQLEHQIESGELWSEAYTYLTEAFGRGGNIAGTQLEGLLQRYEGLKGMSTLQKDEWGAELNEQIKSGFRWYMEQHKLANRSDMIGKDITFKDANGNKVTGKVGSDGTVTANGKKYSDIYQAPDGSWMTMTAAQNVTPPANTHKAPPTLGVTSNNFGAVTDAQIRAAGLNPSSIVDALKVAIGQPGISNKLLETMIGGRASIAGKNGIANYSGTAAQNTQMLNLLKQGKLRRYKQGGLAYDTGLAWLDGTKRKPERILSASQTEAFEELVEHLTSPSIDKNSMNATQTYYNIAIDVDSISNDYDVEQLWETLKKKIYSEAGYRNVNALGRNIR